ncbi:MAG TPA: response regulator [Burkholderiaceae bacterium]|jgi:CheY-like chemotaxis protein|nr:response regulator [Burkholderiaceae bacterium]
MSNLTILVVDDDAGHIELVRRNLQRSGINNPIVSLNSGALALDFIFRRGEYTARLDGDELLVLLDINMPGLDGVEVLRQIKAHPDAKRIPVLMLTTTDDPREINRCYDLGCSVYITKPVNSAAFIEAIKRLGLFISIMSLPIDPARIA